jgi:hypothetical protein
MTLCVIAPETALTVTCVVAGAAGVVAAAWGAADDEQPVIPAVATTSRRAKIDPPARIDLRFRPAKANSPTGPMNARVRPTGDWNKWRG